MILNNKSGRKVRFIISKAVLCFGMLILFIKIEERKEEEEEDK